MDAPKGLSALLDDKNNSIRLSWTPPQSLTPINGYELHWNKIAIAEIPGNVLDYTFVFSKYNISRCEDQVIMFSLRGYNPAGEGASSNISVRVEANTVCDTQQSCRLTSHCV